MPRLGVRFPLSPPRAPVAQRIERRRPKSRVGGSNPSRGTIQERSSVWPERWSPKPVVGGSNPPAPAILQARNGLLSKEILGRPFFLVGQIQKVRETTSL